VIREPSVSIIVPFYNIARRFLQEAVASVLSQSFDAWELLLVDDGSTGESTAFAMTMAARFPGRIRYLEHPGHENRGISATRMLGVGAARGEYLAFLDADDVWLPRKLEQQTALLAAYPEAAMVYGRTKYWYSWTGDDRERGRDFFPKLGVRHTSVVPPPLLLPLYLRGLAAVPCPCSVMVRRTVFEQIGGFEASFRTMYEDQVFYAKVCLAAPVLVATAAWDLYRRHADSICEVVGQAGQEQTARLFYLRWLEQYLTQQGVKDHETWAALREELARINASGEQPLSQAALLRRRVRKFVVRMRGHAL
jgi:glycosyltransferase involved in cell wall biosynthesis